MPTEDEEEVTVLFLCEQDVVFLKPRRLYRFIVDYDCKRCLDIAEICEPNLPIAPRTNHKERT